MARRFAPGALRRIDRDLVVLLEALEKRAQQRRVVGPARQVARQIVGPLASRDAAQARAVLDAYITDPALRQAAERQIEGGASQLVNVASTCLRRYSRHRCERRYLTR